MSKKVKLDKIVMTIGGKEITLSLEEAQELRGILNETFGDKVVERQIVRDRWVYPWWEYRPYRTVETVPYIPYTTSGGTIDCGSTWTVSYSGDSNVLALSVG